MCKQVSDTVLMVEPSHFGFNQQTSIDNLFQKESKLKANILQAMAKDEFYEMINYLRSRSIKVIVMKSESKSPDSVFVNDWISTHYINDEPYIFVYPLYSETRRTEVEPIIIKKNTRT